MPVMKRLLVLLTAAVLAAGLTGCVKDDDSGNGGARTSAPSATVWKPMRKRGCCKIVYFAAPYLFVIKTNVIVQLLQALLYIQTAVARANWEAAHNMFPCSITLRLEVTWKNQFGHR